MDSVISRAQALIALNKAGLFEAKIGGGVSRFTHDENCPKIESGFFETNHGREFHYSEQAIGHLVLKEGLDDFTWDLRYVVINEPGHKMAEVYLCCFDTDVIEDQEVYTYSPLYFIGQVTADIQ